MKRIYKILWLYLEIVIFFLNRNEAFMRFCASDKRFIEDNQRPGQHYYFILNERKEIIGSFKKQLGEWVCSMGYFEYTYEVYNVKSIRQLKKLLKKYAK